jgi:tripartite-type tricarboxylate transporter receptor subunit TctC
MNCLRTFCAVAVLALSGGVLAQTWPDRPISLVVGFPPGGGVDIVARQLADKLSEQLGQRVAVDNRAGANGNVAMDFVARARPDGYTLLMGNVGNLAINPALYSKLTFDTLKDFVPISRVIVQPLVAVVPSASPITNLAQLLATLRAKPGEINFGSGGNGNINHLSGELLKLQAGVQFTHIPYKGSAPAVADLVAGRVQLMIDGANVMTNFVRDGRLRAIYTTGEARSPAYPDVPTARESGLPDMIVYGWQGVLAPTGTPGAIVERVSQEVARSLALPDLRTRLVSQGTEPSPQPPAQFGAFLAAEHKRYGEVVRSAKVSLD